MDILKDFFPSHFIKALDLDGDTALTIKKVVAEEHGFPKRKSACVYFNENDKCIGLNKTNATTLVAMFGRDSTAWHGERITIYPTKTNFQGKQVPCIRIRDRAPAQAQPAQTQADAQPPAPASDTLPDNLRKRLHAVGVECYGKDWDERRAALVAATSTKFRGQAIESSNDLTGAEAIYLIEGMKRKVAESGPADDSQPSGAEWSATTRDDLVSQARLTETIEELDAIDKKWMPLANRMIEEDGLRVAESIGLARERIENAL
jgi:hypothetical protein